MMKTNQLHVVTAVAALALGVAAAPLSSASSAEYAWIAAASSPSHEQLDWGSGADRDTAASTALAQCARLQRANDCRLLAASPDCVAVVWDGAQPLNQAHGASGGGPKVVLDNAIRAAGTQANDPVVRCTWF